MQERSVQTVLLVDDSEPVLNGWARELGGLGKRVLRARRRRDVGALLREQRPDLAVVDLFLDHENGLDIVRDLKAAAPDGYVIVVTGAPSVAYTMEAVRAGADEVFAKPVNASHMVQVAEGLGNADFETESTPPPTLAQLEWEHITQALLDCNGNVSATARRLGIYRQTLQRKLRRGPPKPGETADDNDDGP